MYSQPSQQTATDSLLGYLPMCCKTTSASIPWASGMHDILTYILTSSHRHNDEVGLAVGQLYILQIHYTLKQRGTNAVISVSSHMAAAAICSQANSNTTTCCLSAIFVDLVCGVKRDGLSKKTRRKHGLSNLPLVLAKATQVHHHNQEVLKLLDFAWLVC